MSVYQITPIGKPRQTRSDKWNKRKPVLEYRAFADECRLKIREKDLNHCLVIFRMPMPDSWPAKKRMQMVLQPHQQKPDLDNLAKALFDALYGDDSSIHSIKLMKVWSSGGGAIEIFPDDDPMDIDWG